MLLSEYCAIISVMQFRFPENLNLALGQIIENVKLIYIYAKILI